MKAHVYSMVDEAAIDWPATAQAEVAQRWLGLLASAEFSHWIRNVRTEQGVCICGDTVLPYTCNEHVAGNSYVCSPHTHYIAYGAEELEKLGHGWWVRALQGVVGGLGQVLLRLGLDRVVYVNNWLLSTNLYPEVNAAHVQAIHHALLTKHTRHAIVFRSVDEAGNKTLFQTLLRLGYQPVFSRMVWYQDARTSAVTAKKAYKIDLRLLARTPYQVLDGAALDADQFERCVHLYNLLYLQKHSHYNPQFTAAYLQNLCESGLLRVKALAVEGRIDAVLGYYVRRGIATAPIFGYDTALPQELGLYRLLSTLLTRQAQQHDLLLNCSAGVGRFKKLRGSVAAIEYNMVYRRHLGWWQRLPWWILQTLMNRVGIPVIRKMEL